MGAIALAVAWRSIVAEERRAVAREAYAEAPDLAESETPTRAWA
jgi:hypothetical protein